MIHGKLADWKQLVPNDKTWLAAGFEAAVAHQGGDLTAPGRHFIDEERCFIDAHCYTTQKLEDGSFENHHRYVDIQFIISGREVIFTRPVPGLETKMAYDSQKDAELFHQVAGDNPKAVLVKAGEFLVLFPGEAHMAGRSPETGANEVKKLVVKVLMPK